MFVKKYGFYSVRLLASCQTPKLEDPSWSADHVCLFNIFADNLHIWRPTPHPQPEGMCLAMVTVTHRWIQKPSLNNYWSDSQVFQTLFF